uniref:Uncharacterized protein n=1 Tax=Anopheles farauti TaxID=69004 RepID=A0A182QZJ0_9DIPT
MSTPTNPNSNQILLFCAASIVAFSAAYRGQRHHGGSHDTQHLPAPVKHLHPPSIVWPSTKQPSKSSNEIKSAYSKHHFLASEPPKELPTKPVHPISYSTAKSEAQYLPKSDHGQDKVPKGEHKHH